VKCGSYIHSSNNTDFIPRNFLDVVEEVKMFSRLYFDSKALTDVTIKSVIFGVVSRFSAAGVKSHFGGTHCPLLQGLRVN
jgi:hypothetical protein